MNLYKQLTIALLCSSMVSPLCMAMEDNSQIKEKRKANIVEKKYYKNATSVAEINYNIALEQLSFFVCYPNESSAQPAFEDLVKHATLSANESYSAAQDLLNFLNSLGGLEAAKTTIRMKDSFIKIPSLVSTQAKSYVFLSQLYYMLENFEEGFSYLSPLLNINYLDIQDLLYSLFETSPDAVSHFEKKLNSLFEQGHNNKEKIQSLFLDALCKHKYMPNRLNVSTLDEIGTRYWRVFCMLDNKKEYLEQAILYSLLCAKKWDDPIAVVRHRLIDIINTKNAYDIYYAFLMPYLKAGDEQAQDLFNEVAYASPGAFKWFDIYAANQLKEKGDQLYTVDRVMSIYDRFRSQKRSGQSRKNLISPNYPAGFDFFAGETPVVGIHAGSSRIQENEPLNGNWTDGLSKLAQEIPSNFTGSELFKLAMKHMGYDNAATINYLLQAEGKGNREAKKKLAEVKKNIKRIKNPSQMKTDSLEYFLYQKEKSNEKVVISDKKESKITSQKSASVNSPQEKQSRKKHVINGENEGINTVTPISSSSSMPTKKERRLHRSKLLETSQSMNESTVTNTQSEPIPLEIVNTSALEAPKIDLVSVQMNPVVDMFPAFQETKGIDKELLPVIIVSNDQIATESKEESGKSEEIIESPISITETASKTKVRKTLSRTNSLNLEKPAKSKETSTPRTLHRTKSLMMEKHLSQDSDIIHSEEPKRKKKKEHSTKISLKNYLPIHKSQKKLERKNSQSNLLELGSETPQLTSTSSQPDSKTHNPFKRLTRSLSDRDLKRKSDVPLTETVISSTLNELKSQGVVEWTRSGNTISATKKDDPETHITIHTHDKSDIPWTQRPEIVSDFLEFSSECDEDLKDAISQIGKKEKSSKKL